MAPGENRAEKNALHTLVVADFFEDVPGLDGVLPGGSRNPWVFDSGDIGSIA